MNDSSSATGAVPTEAGIRTQYEKKEWRWAVLWVFLLYLCVHLFIFRNVLVALPDLLAGRSVLNTSELVPFFDTSSQFIEQISGSFSKLTHTFEFRVRYSVLTTWMRHHLILPFAIVLAPLFGSFFVCLALSHFLRGLLPSLPPRRVLYATALATLLIHLILLPAKITHFYTLILGFDIFVISLALFLQGILVETTRPVRVLLAASIVALVNPAVHFLVLYPFTVLFFCAGTGIILLIIGRKTSNGGAVSSSTPRRTMSPLARRMLLALLFTLLFTILPYALFVKFYVLNDISGLSDIVPDSIASIRASSLSLRHQITFDMTSVTENYLRGGYIPPNPRYAKLFYFLVALVPLFAGVTYVAQERRRLFSFVILLVLLMLFSMWCSIGYADIILFPTFHTMLADLYNKLYTSPEHWAQAATRIIADVIHVLRYPDRFLFIYLATVSFLMPLGILAVGRQCAQRRTMRWIRATGMVLCGVLFFLPLFAHWEYRSALLTGDFGGFLRPYNIASLREIKDALDPLPRGKTIVLPPAEGPWLGKTTDGHTYKFIDKFFIYYLNKPSYYFGVTGDPQVKYWFFLIMQSLSKHEHGWINILRNLDIRYLVINKEMRVPRQSVWYLPEITQALLTQPESAQNSFKKIVENDSFALFELMELPKTTAAPALVAADWQAHQCLLERTLSLTTDHHLVALHSPASTGTGQTLNVFGADDRKTRLDLFARENPAHFFRPDQSSFAFNPDHLPSSQYFSMILPMLNTLTSGAYNIFKIVMPGPYGTLTTSFVGLSKSTAIRFYVDAPHNGTYEILLRGIPTQHSLALDVDRSAVTSINITPETTSTQYVTAASVTFGIRSRTGATIPTETAMTELPKTLVPVGDAFSYIPLGTVDLLKGRHHLLLHKNDPNPLVIEGILLVPALQYTTEPPLRNPARFLSPDTLTP